MVTVRKAALLAGISVAIVTTTAGITSAILHTQALNTSSARLQAVNSAREVCKTIATDPNPPLNVRSSPVVASDNIVGELRNGTPVVVIDEQDGWLRINHPMEGWISKQLTVTSCIPVAVALQTAATAAAPTTILSSSNTSDSNRSSRNGSTDGGQDILTQATETYQAGNLAGAIALAKTVAPGSPAYQAATDAILQWQRDWKTAAAEFNLAQRALQQGQWQQVLQKVKDFPENRFWRAKLTPIVQAAIQQQSKAESNTHR